MEPKFYIDYPQEKIEQGVNLYQCAICKVSSLSINGLLANHKPSCKYRIDNEERKNN